MFIKPPLTQLLFGPLGGILPVTELQRGYEIRLSCKQFLAVNRGKMVPFFYRDPSGVDIQFLNASREACADRFQARLVIADFPE